MNTNFHLKYRPSKFGEFIGNQRTIRSLLQSWPEWPTSFLLVGPPGIGKTTLARLISKQVEADESNIKEVDAGQDRGIDKIRELVKGAYYRPLVGKSKVYIIDECQGLTADAQQALLKITEEPPKNTYFIFCSTDPKKIIKALKARCEHGFYELFPLERKEIGQIIKHISEEEGIKLEGTIKDIAVMCVDKAEGIPRNAIMLFNKFKSYDDPQVVAEEISTWSEDYVPNEIFELVNLLDKSNLSGFAEKFLEYKTSHYESLRIALGKIFKGKLLNALANSNANDIRKYNNIISMFSEPVDNNVGDITLVHRLANYYEISFGTKPNFES